MGGKYFFDDNLLTAKQKTQIRIMHHIWHFLRMSTVVTIGIMIARAFSNANGLTFAEGLALVTLTILAWKVSA
jgi:hypothetical protein